MKLKHSLVIVMILLALTSCKPDINEDSTAEEKAALAEIKLQEGDNQRALELFESALLSSPSSPETPFWEMGRAEALLVLGNPSEAITQASTYLSAGNAAVRARAALLKAMAETSTSPVSSLLFW